MTEKLSLATGSAIDLAKLGAFMKSRADDYRCPICANLDWIAVLDEFGHASAVPWALASGEPEARGVAMVTLCCTKCGFTRQHHLEILKTYLEGSSHGG